MIYGSKAQKPVNKKLDLLHDKNKYNFYIQLQIPQSWDFNFRCTIVQHFEYTQLLQLQNVFFYWNLDEQILHPDNG